MNQNNHKMKMLPKIISVITLPVFIFLIYRYFINDDWNKNERIIFIICLGVGFINMVLLYYQKWREKNTIQ
jgi:hypothetical protein